jgi:hypothetical protein
MLYLSPVRVVSASVWQTQTNITTKYYPNKWRIVIYEITRTQAPNYPC